MIHFTGDTHGNFLRFGSKYFPEQKQMSRDDSIIICGDFGGLWDGSKAENNNLDWLDEKPFTTLWIDGNHENYSMLGQLPVEEWHGGKVQRVRPNILHLMRGQLYEIDGYTFFTMGGAASHDIQDGILDPNAPNFEITYRRMRRLGRMFRVKGRSWWPEEMPSEEEYATALATLERCNWEVDYVVTHCAPTGIQQILSNGYQPDALTDFLDMVSKRLKFHYWLFGHYHKNQNIGQNYVLLYEQIVQAI